MDRVAIFVLILVSAFDYSGVRSVLAQSSTEKLEQYKRDQLLHNSVLIRATDISGRNSFGFGLIFGRTDNVVWIATAAHLVFQDYDGKVEVGMKPASRIEVMRREYPRQWLARTPEPTNVSDLAILPVEMPLHEIGSDRWSESVIESDPRPGDPVHLAGYQQSIDYFKSGARITSVDTADEFEVVGLQGAKGQSGAPVVTNRGIIGLYTQSAGQRFIPISEIRKAVLDANQPWDLTDVPQRVETTQLCLNVRGVQPETIRVTGPTVTAHLDELGCAATTSGTNKISSNSRWISCVPDRINIPPGGATGNIVTCEISPKGIWSSQDGFLKVSTIEENIWKLEEGLHRSPYGWVTGKLTGIPPLLSFDGRTQTNQLVSGQVRLELRRLSGRVFVDGTSWDIELMR